MYDYQIERPKLFTEEHQSNLLKVRDRVKELLDEAGAFMLFSALNTINCPDSWTGIAYIDRLVELGYIREITDSSAAGQHRVFVKA